MRGTITARWNVVTERPAARHAPGQQAHSGHLYGIWILLVSCIVAWRQGSFYTGGMDPVVLIKAALQATALFWAAAVCLNSPKRYPLGMRSLGFLMPILAVSMVGALASGNLSASAIIAVRVLMMALTVMFLMRAFPVQKMLLAMCLALSLVGLLSAGSGLVLGDGGRLSGGIPPLSPNEIALLAGLPGLFLLHEGLRARIRWFHGIALAVLCGVLVLSESRTALIGAACAVGLLLIFMRRIPMSIIVTVLLVLPVVFYTVFLTPMVQNFMSRDDSASVLTLNSRTISWSVVLNLPWDSWERWFGEGLSMKTIAVQGQYWDEQVFDSSWISLLAQTGVIGTGIAMLWVLACVLSAVRSRKVRSIYLGLLMFVLIRSIMENGLIDAGVMFLVFFTLSLSLEAPSLGSSPDWNTTSPLKPRSP